MTVRVWRCGNCGHTVPVTDNLEGLDFRRYDALTSRVGCKACGSYTIQRANDESFTVGYFLIVRSHLRHYGKGK